MVLIPQILSNGYSLTLTKQNGSYATCVVEGSKEFPRSQVRSKSDVDNGLSFPTYIPIDLGLSVKWATFNVGATAPEEYGDYYTWGDVDTYYKDGYAHETTMYYYQWKDGKTDGYTWKNYKWNNGNGASLTKYCNNSNFGYNGFTDDKTVLDPEDDVAHVAWGENWRIPTQTEIQELLDNCDWTWTTRNNVNGYLVTSNVAGYTNRSIFLPAAGSQSTNSGLRGAGTNGYYWSSSLYNTPAQAYGIKINDSSHDIYDLYRYGGYSVRPVCP